MPRPRQPASTATERRSAPSGYTSRTAHPELLCDVYGMDYDEVSLTTSVPVGTVKSRIHRGRLRLRVLLADQRELFEE